MNKDMKRSLKYFGMTLMALAGMSCSREVIIPEPQAAGGSIMLDVSSMPHTKLSQEDLESKGAEAYVMHVDLFVFGEQTDASAVYHERFSYASPAQPETKSLSVNKTQFKSGQEYDIYAIANSTASADEMSTVASVEDLAALTQTDEYLYFTGLDGENVPEAFLMDARLSAVVLNPEGYESENAQIDIQLTRAAAKVVVELFEGEDIAFQDPDNSHVYHYRNLPYSTAVLSGVAHTPSVRSTAGHQVNGYVKWDKDAEGSLADPQISITGYMYSYDYSGQDLDKHTSLVVNIPLQVTQETGSGTQVKDYPVNYYKIPLTNALKFDRNKMYRIRAIVKAPGAQTSFDPLELTGLQYDVIDWYDTNPEIPAGGTLNKPAYLQLNRNHVDIYNVNTEEAAIHFASSSYITSVTLLEAYYKNSMDETVHLSSSTQADRSVYNQIQAIYPTDALNGEITIYSPFVADQSAGISDSHKNAIRYMTFEVVNENGNKIQFTVAQYPTLYITNVHGMYSYREDFSANNALSVSWSSSNKRWQYYSGSSEGGFFASKVTVSSSGGYSIRYASRWSSDGTRLEAGSSSLSMFNNPRMYHIHVTATSSEYIVARPKLDENDYTEMTADNSRLVSPSFLIASQLGATETSGGSSGVDIEKARRHCKEYIEVSGGRTYKDWRLPTKAEIDIIEKHQHSSPAMAEVLNGSHYYCAYNPEYEEYTDPSNRYYNDRKDWIYTVRDIGSSGSVHVRCVHDSYGE